MIDVNRISILDLLPPSLNNDVVVRDLALALDKELKEITLAINEVEIMSRIDDLSEDVIEHLLWQLHMTHDEGTGLASTIEEKCSLVKNALKLHKMKGTKAALEYILELLNFRGFIEEWFEYGGEPGYFRIRILEVTNKSISEERLTLLDKLISTYKNTRSWLETINIYLTTHAKMYLASITIAGEEATIYPWSAAEIMIQSSARLGSASRSVELIAIYPRKE